MRRQDVAVELLYDSLHVYIYICTTFLRVTLQQKRICFGIQD